VSAAGCPQRPEAAPKAAEGISAGRRNGLGVARGWKAKGRHAYSGRVALQGLCGWRYAVWLAREITAGQSQSAAFARAKRCEAQRVRIGGAVVLTGV